MADFQCAQLLGPRYRRLDGPLSGPIPLDAADRAKDLITLAQAVPLEGHVAWLTGTFLGPAPAVGGGSPPG